MLWRKRKQERGIGSAVWGLARLVAVVRAGLSGEVGIGDKPPGGE